MTILFSEKCNVAVLKSIFLKQLKLKNMTHIEGFSNKMPMNIQRDIFHEGYDAQ